MAQAQVYTDTLAAYFEDSSDARKAVDELQEAGFRSAHLGIAHHGSYTGETITEGTETVHETEEKGSSSAWDKIKSWFSGVEAEPYADERARDAAQREVIPPADRFDEGYDDTSDLHGSFTAMNIPEDRARYFSHRFGRNQRSAIVTVQTGERKAETESILNRYNADFGENASGYEYSQESGAYQYDERDRESGRAEGPGKIQLLGEVLRVHKDRVNRGDVRTRDDQASVAESTVVRDEVFASKKPVEQVRDAGGDVRREELIIDDETKRERSA